VLDICLFFIWSCKICTHDIQHMIHGCGWAHVF
jgi:hypothetical protein